MAIGTGGITISVPAAAGVAKRIPTRSRILPSTSASISHARIFAGDRSPDNARYLHEILKEQP